LNKTDQINYDKDKIHEIKDYITLINPLAKIILTEFSDVSLDFFLEDSAFAVGLSNLVDFNEIEDKDKHVHEHFHEKESIESIVCEINIDDMVELDRAIGKIIWDLSDQNDFSVIRFKGVVYKYNLRIYSIQGIYDLYEIKEIKYNETEKFEAKKSKILLIGKNLKKNKLIIQNVL
jgi:G3E family GTPase